MLYFTVKWKRPRRALKPQELNNYPQTPAPTGVYPAFERVKSFRFNFDFNHQKTLELNNYPEPLTVLNYPAWNAVQLNKKTNFNIGLQLNPALRVYPPLVPHTAWTTAPIKKVSFRFSLQSIPELNNYPQTPTIELYPAWLKPNSSRSKFKIKRQLTPPVNVFPQRVLSAPYPSWQAKESFKQQFKITRLTLVEVVDPPVAVPPTIPTSGGLYGSQSTGNGISGNQSAGNGIMSTQSTGNGVSGSGGL